MLERLLILLGVVLLVAALWGVLRLWRARRIARLAVETPLAGYVASGRPAVVAFSTPSCAECRTRQAPALAQLAAELGDQATIRSLSALDHAQLVDRLGILTVPATVVVDESGMVRHINLGFADAGHLASQIRGVATT